MNAPMKTDISLQPVPSWSEEDRARADHYALLARLFYAAPDEALLQALVASSSALGQGQGAFAEAWRALGAAAASHSAAAVADEYAALFISVGKPKVMLNGSWYLTGFLQEEPLAELRDELAELGLGRRQGVAETEDHLAALAEVMRHLVLTAPDEAGLARQRGFFHRHLARWYGDLAAAIAAAPEADFYIRAGGLLQAFFDIERQAFDMV
ncbi:molecular chaperone [Azoarcus communis]|uniref:TorD/DmsD family molecular chaperone n=1 Tax=Parazoarcus communis TaxID=41977 RepID=UPI001459BFF3|nr:molecular chaperone TorD family protein [Parazoarcus communis]NMG50139.1 molecular chaperone [Parazoarcus communis]